jgi:predicted ATP-grasp superfamily ATP-dependent carboligase
MALYARQPARQPDQPVLVVALEGWVDAGLGATSATTALLGSIPTEVLATFDGDDLIDQRARRPVLRIVDGVNAGLTWPEIRLLVGEDRTGNDIVLLVGPEPDLHWRPFVASVVELAQELGVRLAVGLGAFPAAAPHTRPVRLAATATTPELASRVGVVPGTLEVPAGIEGALEEGFAATDIPAVGLWARVPHYVSAMPYPAASAALVDGLASVAGLTLESAGLHSAADVTRSRVDELIAQSSEHKAMVSQLEDNIDAAEGTPLDLGTLPSGDEIAAELERYLRGER